LPGKVDEDGTVVGTLRGEVREEDGALVGVEDRADGLLDVAEVWEVGGGRGKGELEGLGGRDPGPDAAGDGTHVSGHQLVPGIREGLVEGGEVGGEELHVFLVSSEGIMKEGNI
jgi:hypothetical protein